MNIQQATFNAEPRMHYGEGIELILWFASFVPRFTIWDIPVERDVHWRDAMVRHLVRRGRLKVVRPGRRGRVNPRPAVYTLTTTNI